MVTDSLGPSRENIGYFTFRDRYVLPPTVVRSFPPIALTLSNYFAFGGKIEVGSGTNLLLSSRFHFWLSTNLADTAHLTGLNAENFLRQQAGTNYSPDLLMNGRE